VADRFQGGGAGRGPGPDTAESGDQPSCDLTVGDVVARYVETESGITEGTRGSYRQEAARDILGTLGPLPLVALARDTVRRWINSLAAPLTDLEIAAHRSVCPRCTPATDGRPTRDCRALSQRRDGLSGKTIANRDGLLLAACNGHLNRLPGDQSAIGGMSPRSSNR
jgi:hypothetical protein